MSAKMLTHPLKWCKEQYSFLIISLSFILTRLLTFHNSWFEGDSRLYFLSIYKLVEKPGLLDAKVMYRFWQQSLFYKFFEVLQHVFNNYLYLRESMFILNLLFSFLIIVSVYFIFKNNNRKPFLPSMLLIFNPAVWIHGLYPNSTTFSVGCLFASLAFLFRQNLNRRHLLGAGVLFAAAFLFRGDALFALPGILSYFIILKRYREGIWFVSLSLGFIIFFYIFACGPKTLLDVLKPSNISFGFSAHPSRAFFLLLISSPVLCFPLCVLSALRTVLRRIKPEIYLLGITLPFFLFYGITARSPRNLLVPIIYFTILLATLLEHIYSRCPHRWKYMYVAFTVIVLTFHLHSSIYFSSNFGTHIYSDPFKSQPFSYVRVGLFEVRSVVTSDGVFPTGGFLQYLMALKTSQQNEFAMKELILSASDVNHDKRLIITRENVGIHKLRMATAYAIAFNDKVPAVYFSQKLILNPHNDHETINIEGWPYFVKSVPPKSEKLLQIDTSLALYDFEAANNIGTGLNRLLIKLRFKIQRGKIYDLVFRTIDAESGKLLPGLRRLHCDTSFYNGYYVYSFYMNIPKSVNVSQGYKVIMLVRPLGENVPWKTYSYDKIFPFK